nr:PaaI family thioesterase [uncultured Carboxylicivirga sp.]
MPILKKIKNPFIEAKGEEYNCFGCSPNNQDGLLMEFFTDEESVFSMWKPRRRFEGYHNVIHGGIQATIMDEIASWTIYALVGTAGVTQKMQVNYHKTLYANDSEIKVVAKVKMQNEKQAIIAVQLINSRGVVCSTAEVDYFLFPEKIAKAKYHYPGKEFFIK